MSNTLYIVSLTYKKALSEVEKYLSEHAAFLDRYYKKGVFILSGRKNPRTGGVILASNVSRSELEILLKEDPFHKNEIADYEIIEVVPTNYAKEFESLFEK